MLSVDTVKHAYTEIIRKHQRLLEKDLPSLFVKLNEQLASKPILENKTIYLKLLEIHARCLELKVELTQNLAICESVVNNFASMETDKSTLDELEYKRNLLIEGHRTISNKLEKVLNRLTALDTLPESIQALCKDITLCLLAINDTGTVESEAGAGSMPTDDRPILSWFKAVELNDVSSINHLIRAGEDIDQLNEKGWSALMLAAFNGYYDMARLLLEARAKIDVTNKHGWNAILLAAEKGHHGLISLLVIYGADIDYRTTDGWTPLLTAIHHNQVEAVKELLSKNADPELHGVKTQPPILVAAKKGNLDILSLLIPKLKICDIAYHGWTPLMAAAEKGHDKSVTLLIDAGSDVETFNAHGYNSLMLAIQNGHIDAVKALIAKGAKVASKQLGKQTSLMVAAVNGRTEIAALLLSQDYTLNFFTMNGQTAADLAQSHGHKELSVWLRNFTPGLSHSKSALAGFSDKTTSEVAPSAHT